MMVLCSGLVWYARLRILPSISLISGGLSNHRLRCNFGEHVMTKYRKKFVIESLKRFFA